MGSSEEKNSDIIGFPFLGLNWKFQLIDLTDDLKFRSVLLKFCRRHP